MVEPNYVISSQRPAVNYDNNKASAPVLFGQQFLEKPVLSEEYKMAKTPTMCTFRDLPFVDDF